MYDTIEEILMTKYHNFHYTPQHHKRYVIKLLNLRYGRTVGIKQSRYTKTRHMHTPYILSDLILLSISRRFSEENNDQTQVKFNARV